MTMKVDLLAGLRREWITPARAYMKYNCLSLAQRVSEWRAERRWCSKIPEQRYTKPPPNIIDKWVKLPNGKMVKAYKAVP